MRFRPTLGAVLLAGAACGGSGGPTSGNGSSPPPGGSVGVTIQDYSFSPSSRTVARGTTVRWSNNGPSTHTSTSDAGAWDSGPIGGPGSGEYGATGQYGGTYDRTFSVAGTYEYHCTFHSDMRGTITVSQ